jgi:predicted GTPase
VTEQRASADALLASAATLLSDPMLAPWPRRDADLDAIAQARARLSSRFVLAVVGEFSSGKSFLLNALLGTVNRTGDRIGGLLAVDINPSTATITELTYGPQTIATAYFASGREERIPIEGLGRFVAVGKDGRGALHGALEDDDAGPVRVNVDVDSPFLARGFVLADTPGLASLNPAHRRATLGYLPGADAVLYLIDTQQPFTEGDAAFLGLIEEYVRVVFIVQTKIDLRRNRLDDGREEWELVRKRIEDRAAQHVPGAAILSVSARDYAIGVLDDDEASRTRSGMPGLLETIDRTLEARVQAARNARARELVRFLAGRAKARTAEEIELAGLPDDELAERTASARETLEERDLALEAEAEALRAAASHAGRTIATLGSEVRETIIRSIARAFDISDVSRLRDRAKLHILVDGVAGAALGAFAAAVAAETADELERLAHDRPDLGIAQTTARAFGGEYGTGAWSRDLAAGMRATIVLGGVGGPVLPFVHGVAQAFASARDGEYMKRELTIDLRDRFLPELAQRIDAFTGELGATVARLYKSVDALLERERRVLAAETLEPIERAIALRADPSAGAARRDEAAKALLEIESLLAAAREPAEPIVLERAVTAPTDRTAEIPAFDADAYASGLRPQRYRVTVLGALDRGKSTFINAVAGSRLLADGAETDARFPIHVRYGSERRAYALVREGAWHDIAIDAAMAQASRSPVLIEVPWSMPRELVLVHAPAFDSGEANAEAIALAAAANASEIVMLFSRQISDREVSVLEHVQAFGRPVLLAHTMADTESAAERRTVVELAQRVVSERRIAIERIFTISGSDALAAAADGRALAPWNELYALRDTLAAHAEEHMARLARRERENAATTARNERERPASGFANSLARLLGKRTTRG